MKRPQDHEEVAASASACLNLLLRMDCEGLNNTNIVSVELGRGGDEVYETAATSGIWDQNIGNG